VRTCSCNKSQQDALFLNFILLFMCARVLVIKANKMHCSSLYFDKELCMFWTDWLSIIRSLNTVFTAVGICLVSFVDCLLARSGRTVSLSETCRVLYRNKVEKQCILLAFITRTRAHINNKIKLRNSASCWLLLQEYITMHSPLNVEVRTCVCLLWGRAGFSCAGFWYLSLISIIIFWHVQSDSESDLSQAQRPNTTVASRVNCLMRPTISSQNKVTNLGGSKSMTNQNTRRRGPTAAYSAGTKCSAYVLNLNGTVNYSGL